MRTTSIAWCCPPPRSMTHVGLLGDRRSTSSATRAHSGDALVYVRSARVVLWRHRPSRYALIVSGYAQTGSMSRCGAADPQAEFIGRVTARGVASRAVEMRDYLALLREGRKAVAAARAGRAAPNSTGQYATWTIRSHVNTWPPVFGAARHSGGRDRRPRASGGE